MAINPLQFPQQGPINAKIDWSPLQNLVDLLNQRQQEANAADILGGLYQQGQQQPSQAYPGAAASPLASGDESAAVPPSPQPTQTDISIRPPGTYGTRWPDPTLGQSYPPLASMAQTVGQTPGTQPTALSTAASAMGWMPQ